MSLAEQLPPALSEQYIYIQSLVPGRTFIGIAIPNRERTLVTLREILESNFFICESSPLCFALGRDVAGNSLAERLAKLPHLLITGTTGSGKSVCIHAILTSLLLHNTPDDLRLVLVDTKLIELSCYNGIPHLLGPVIGKVDKIVHALLWCTREMDKRYQIFVKTGVRNIVEYNERVKLQGGKKIPYILIVIDELVELMSLASEEIEKTMAHLTYMGSATGIHMIITTLQLSKQVLPDSIKDNFPARAAFDMTSKAESCFILGKSGV